MIWLLEKFLFKKNLETNHILINEITNENKSSRIVLILLKAGLIFIAAYCTVAGLLDTFKVPYSRMVIIIAFIIGSIYFGMVYAHKIVFYSGYIIFSFVFLLSIVRYYMEANSGFQAVINTIYKSYSDYFNLASIREGQEFFENRYYTVTVAAIFFGIFLIMLLNITISGYMNVLETILITFPFIEIALFINKIPSIFYLIGLCFVYMSVAILQFSKHSRLQVKGKHTHEFTRYSRKDNFYYFYQADTKIFLFTFIMAAVISVPLCFSLISVSNKETSKIPRNAIHKQTNEYVKVYIQSGFTGFLNGYSSTGGLARGKLGGVSQVRPDFETDITVTYAPNNYETIYLKGFTGNQYNNNLWTEDFIVNDNGTNLGVYMKDIEAIENTREYPFGNDAKMILENVGASTDFTYAPYFVNRDEILLDHLNDDNKPVYTISYHPMTSRTEFEPIYEDKLLEDEFYNKYVNEYCLQSPDNITETLESTLDLIGLEKSDSYTNEERLECARKIYEYYFNNFDYTMAPGSTPRNRDFIGYFLSEQHRGFCAHFASAEVILLRELGIPARYCEGYVIPLSLVDQNGAITEDKYEDFYSGSSIVDTNAVITVDINDSYAHAWVEIYLEGYGFVPFEATIPSSEDDNFNLAMFNFASLFSGIINNNQDIDDLETPTTDATGLLGTFAFLNNITAYTGSVSKIVIIFISLLIFAILMYLFVKFLILRIKLMIYKKNNDEYHLVKYEYNKLTAKMRRKRYLTKENPLPEDVKKAYNQYINDYNIKHKKPINVNTEELFRYYEKVMYS